MLLRLIFPHLLGAWLLLSFFPGELRSFEIGETPIKLCGREFIRAVIFTCGGSRWKRIAMTQLEQMPEQLLVPGGSDVENVKLDPEFIYSYKERKNPLLKKVKKLLESDNHMKFNSPSEKDFWGVLAFMKKAGMNLDRYISFNSLRPHHLNLWMLHRKKRDTSTGLSNYCCEVACTKNDIAKMC